MKDHNMIKSIVITGAESTGKTTLAGQLALHYKTVWIPEYARDYVEKLGRKYNYNDVVHIARKQISQAKLFEAGANRFIFFDTWLIITKIWFLEVFGTCPPFVDDEIRNYKIDLFLVCDNDLQWIPDPVRENNDKREYLSQLYKNEINNYNYPYELIKGKGINRFNNAVLVIEKLFAFK